ncbi:hypothetical protein [Treponema sp.]|uniref:hypothetical protein n=1 Tax=Treponema sp. TaxID=166 RepID=UPI00298E8509|nr:hypothetical protein [Treponema sp.]MCQ2240457.1 hypothetical protein [Treponema sp.]
MKSAEKAYDDLKNKLLSELPLYIEEINKEYNDGIILEQFTNTDNNTINLKLPYWKINFEEAEYSEKDILIENTVFKFSIELHAIGNGEELMRKLWRYGEAIAGLGLKVNQTKNEKYLITLNN